MQELFELLKEIKSKCYNQSVHLYRVMDDGALQIIRSQHDDAYLKIEPGEYPYMRQYVIRSYNKDITSFCLTQMVGCCAICVSSNVYVHPEYRKRGINKVGNRIRQWIAKEQGYSILLCTDAADNEGERKTLEANGFRDILEIPKNPRTGNRVFVSIKELR